MELNMKTVTSLLASLTIVILPMAANTQTASAAVVYCQYIDYPANCVARPGVVLKPRVVAPVRNQAIRENRGTVGSGSVNRGGPVDRAGRR
jgi:hypothetical protein